MTLIISKVGALKAELLQSLGPGWRVGLSTGTQQGQCLLYDLRPRQRWNSPCSLTEGQRAPL